MSIQIRRTTVRDHASPNSIKEMQDRGTLMESDAKTRKEYFKIIPVVYTRLAIRRLSNFDPEHKTMDIHYKVYLTWPQRRYRGNTSTDEVFIDLVTPEMVSVPVKKGMTGGYRYYPDYPDSGLHLHECYSRKATVHWDAKLQAFPFDVHRIEVTMRIYGHSANELIMAVDTEAKAEIKTIPNIDDEFQLASDLDSPYTYRSKLPYALADPVTGKELYYYVSTYETSFVLRRKLSNLQLLVMVLPVALLVGGWRVFSRVDRSLAIGTTGKVLGGIGFTLLLAFHGWNYSQYKPAWWAPSNMSFIICILIVLMALICYVRVEGDSDREQTIPLFRSLFGAATVIVLVYALWTLTLLIRWCYA